MAGLAEFMDSYAPGAGDEPFHDPVFRGLPGPGGAALADSGPGSQVIARAARSPELAEQVLASLFWWCYVRTQRFRSESPAAALPGQRQIIVSHDDGGTRHSLLVLAPAAHGALGVAVEPAVGRYLSFGQIGGEISAVALAEQGRLRAILGQADIDVDPNVPVLAVDELSARSYFSMVVAADPDETLTTAPTTAGAAPFVAPAPALSVTMAGQPGVVATAGVVGTDAAGRVLAVTALHAIAKARATGAGLLVGGVAAGVVTTHEVTDSCVLSVGCRDLAGAGRSGLLGFPPAEHRLAAFYGAASGPKQTRIRGYDLSVLDPSPYLGSKVYTDPDTILGDSGSALIDGDDHIVGFAVSRTALGAPLEFSTWSWAPQVLAGHGLV